MKVSSIARNTSFFTLALVIQKVITFAYFTFLARNLDPSDLGKFYLAISFSSIFLTIIDLGQANLLMKEVAKLSDPVTKSRSNIVNTVIAIKLPLIILSSVSVFLLANLMNYPQITKLLIYYSISLMVMDSLATTFFSIIRGHHNLKYESFVSVITQLIIMISGIIFVLSGFSLVWIIIAQVIGTVFRFSSSLLILITKLKVSLRPDFDLAKIKTVLLITVPFAMYAVYNKLYLYLDTVLLSKMAGDFETGLYQIAFKFIFALQFLPLAFVASLYPAFSAYWKEINKDVRQPPNKLRLFTPLGKGGFEEKISPSQGRGHSESVITSEVSPSPCEGGGQEGVRPQLTITFERAINYLSIISLPIAFGIFAIAPEIINIFKPEYAAAVWPLRVSILALVFIFLNYPIGSLLNACDKQKENTRNMGIVMAISIIVNILLIPRYQALGASFTVLATNILMFILGLVISKQVIKLRFKKLLPQFFKALLAAFFMALAVLYLKESMNIFVLVFIAALIYAIMVVITGAVKMVDVKSVIKSFFKTSNE